MKKYLVAYNTGTTDSSIVETPDDYVPVSDDGKLLKKLVCEKENPRYAHFSSAPQSCGGYQQITRYKAIDPEDLELIAVSNLGL